MSKQTESNRPAGEGKSTIIEIYDGESYIGAATAVGNSWKLDKPIQLALGQHTLIAKSGSVTTFHRLTVIEDAVKLPLPRPSVKGAHVEPGNQERLDYYADANIDIEVLVDYEMRQGDTVKLYWTGPSITLGSPLQEIKDDPPHLDPFVISRYEVIDAIRRNAVVKYTVRRLPGSETYESLGLDLMIVGDSRGHTFDVAEPSLKGTTLTVTRQPQFNQASTVEVRAIGEVETDIWQSNSKTFRELPTLEFDIDSDWLQRNRSKSVKFNYSLRLTPDKPGEYLYSRLLRVRSLP